MLQLVTYKNTGSQATRIMHYFVSTRVTDFMLTHSTIFIAKDNDGIMLMLYLLQAVQTRTAVHKRFTVCVCPGLYGLMMVTCAHYRRAAADGSVCSEVNDFLEFSAYLKSFIIILLSKELQQ